MADEIFTVILVNYILLYPIIFPVVLAELANPGNGSFPLFAGVLA